MNPREMERLRREQLEAARRMQQMYADAKQAAKRVHMILAEGEAADLRTRAMLAEAVAAGERTRAVLRARRTPQPILRVDPELVSAPIVARSDEGALFELLHQVGGRMPSGGAS